MGGALNIQTGAAPFDWQSTGIIYQRTNLITGQQYIGQAYDFEGYLARQSAEDNALRAQHYYDILQQGIPNAPGSLNLAEENYIRLNGGPRTQGGTLQNLRYQMNEQN